jgi:hypothetical protein
MSCNLKTHSIGSIKNAERCLVFIEYVFHLASSLQPSTFSMGPTFSGIWSRYCLWVSEESVRRTVKILCGSVAAWMPSEVMSFKVAANCMHSPRVSLVASKTLILISGCHRRSGLSFRVRKRARCTFRRAVILHKPNDYQKTSHTAFSVSSTRVDRSLSIKRNLYARANRVLQRKCTDI